MEAARELPRDEWTRAVAGARVVGGSGLPTSPVLLQEYILFASYVSVS
jgi:hypothetical protein